MKLWMSESEVVYINMCDGPAPLKEILWMPTKILNLSKFENMILKIILILLYLLLVDISNII